MATTRANVKKNGPSRGRGRSRDEPGATRAPVGRGLRVLVVDIGGTNVKLLATGQTEPRRFPSGPRLRPRQMVAGVRRTVPDWPHDVVAIGYPGPVVGGRPAREPHNLGRGWTRFDFAAAFGRPVRILNDAALQALGSYHGGRMLFLGLGTGLGSAMVVDDVVVPMELAHLPYRKATFEHYVGAAGMERMGRRKWERHVHATVEALVAALVPDDVVLGGGNAKRLRSLPKGCRLGDNANAFLGGYRLWGASPRGTRGRGAARP